VTPKDDTTRIDRVLVVVAALSVLLGVGLRFTALDGKVRSFDETFTGLRMSASAGADADALLRRSPPATAADLVRLQTPQPGCGVDDVVVSVARNEPQHAPLFFVLESLWTRALGASTTSVRGLAALLSAALLPALFLLGRDVLGSRRAGLVTLSLGALAPLLVSFSQDARPHGAALSAFAWATWALVRALPQARLAPWAAYALLLATSGYLYPAILMGAPAHALYAAVAAAPATRRASLARFTAAAATAVLLYSPWLVNYIQMRDVADRMLAWKLQKSSLLALCTSWLDTAVSLRLDAFRIGSLGAIALIAALALAPVIAGAAACLRSPRRWGAFALALGLAVPFGALMALDLAKGGSRSKTPRHAITLLVGTELLAAAAISGALDSGRPAVRLLGAATLATALGAGAASGVAFTQAGYWWTLAGGAGPTLIDQAVGEEPRTLLVLSTEPWRAIGNAFAASHSLPPGVLVMHLEPGAAPEPPPGILRVVFFDRPAALEAALPGRGFRLIGEKKSGRERVVRYDRVAPAAPPGPR